MDTNNQQQEAQQVTPTEASGEMATVGANDATGTPEVSPVTPESTPQEEQIAPPSEEPTPESEPVQEIPQAPAEDTRTGEQKFLDAYKELVDKTGYKFSIEPQWNNDGKGNFSLRLVTAIQPK